MTIKRRKQRKQIIAGIIVLGLCAASVATAWATVTLVKPKDAIYVVDSVEGVRAIGDVPVSSKTRAPEPTTMALFGGGFIGMIMSFVRRTYAMFKRIFDFVSSILGLMFLAPLMILVAVLIKLTSRGPVLYSQTRVGKDGKNFKIFKFRSMKVDAEKDTGPVWAAQNDSRLTPIGSFLRKSHVDELPQLFNVVKGEMSVIGPRPERPVFVKQFKESIPDYERRLTIKPGITGLAQVWHRYDETFQDVKKKLKYDLLYAKKMCLWADFSIILRTFRVVVTGEGAR